LEGGEEAATVVQLLQDSHGILSVQNHAGGHDTFNRLSGNKPNNNNFINNNNNNITITIIPNNIRNKAVVVDMWRVCACDGSVIRSILVHNRHCW
jgi:hypothetical protein